MAACKAAIVGATMHCAGTNQVGTPVMGWNTASTTAIGFALRRYSWRRRSTMSILSTLSHEGEYRATHLFLRVQGVHQQMAASSSIPLLVQILQLPQDLILSDP